MKLFLKKYELYILASIIFLAFSFIFKDFFPALHGKMGIDYLEIMPIMMNNLIWYKLNGIFEIPWYTPFKGGGVGLVFAHPLDLSMSLYQYLMFFFGPVKSAFITFLSFALCGLIGFYLLLKRVFKLNQWVSLTGALLFLFNGFYTYHTLVGHTSYHSFMLLPGIIFFLMWDVPSNGSRRRHKFIQWVPILVASLLLSYSIHTSLLYQHIIFGLTILCVFSFYTFFTQKTKHWTKLFYSLLVTILMSSAKLVALLSVTRYVKRPTSLAGLRDSSDFFPVLFKIFFGNNDNLEKFVFWGSHEWELSITPIPFLFILVCIFYIITKKPQIFYKYLKKIRNNHLPSYAFFILGLFCLWIPFALNAPEFRNFLGKLPLTKYLRTAPRFLSVYIVPIIICSMYCFNLMFITSKEKRRLTYCCCFMIIVFVFIKDKSFYLHQPYSTNLITTYYDSFMKDKIQPRLSSISSNGNHAFLSNESTNAKSLYDSFKENAPIMNELIPETVFLKTKNYLNMRNPACYVYPKANNCKPGDNFLVSQKDELEKFISYKSYDFKMSFVQKIANYLSVSIFFLCLSFLILNMLLALRNVYMRLPVFFRSIFSKLHNFRFVK